MRKAKSPHATRSAVPHHGAGVERPCPCCGGPLDLERRGLYDDRYAYPGRFDLSRCGACGHRRLLADFEPAALGDLYTQYYPRRFLRAEDWRPAPAVRGWRSWLEGDRRSAYSWVPPGVRVLDVGCGLGEALAYHGARGCDAHGVEADRFAQRAAAERGLRVREGLFDARDWPAPFDWVTLDQVVEHAPDPVEMLRGVAAVLRPGGRAVICTPNGRGWGASAFGRRWINWHVPYHLHLFTERSLGAAAAGAGLEVVQSRTITSSAWLYLQWAHLLTRPPEGEPSPLWAPQRAPRGAERAALFAARVVHVTRIDHLLTRLFDALGRGDNLVTLLGKR